MSTGVWATKKAGTSKSRLDTTDDKMDEKYEEYKEAIKTGEFSDEYNLTNKDLEKLKSDSVTTVVPTLLDMMFTDAGFVLPNAVAKEVYEDFQCLYKQYLGRELTAAEKFVFESSIKIMIWKVHGKNLVRFVKRDMLMFPMLLNGDYCHEQVNKIVLIALQFDTLQVIVIFRIKNCVLSPYSLLKQRVKMSITTVLSMIHMIFSINL